MRQVFDQSKAFFALPLKDKTSLLRGPSHRGYTPMNSARLDPNKQTKGDTKVKQYFKFFDCVQLAGARQFCPWC